MLLGKRQRPPIRRTTSLSEFVADLELPQEPPRPSDQEIPAIVAVNHHIPPSRQMWGEGNWTGEWRTNTASSVAAMVSPRVLRRNSGDFTALETAPFLRSCGLCNRRLAPGRDIFMYRGEIAFCSLECRQQQMNHDEKKEKYFISTIKDSPPATSGSSDPSTTGETVAAT
ncbi:hypothetical protein KFK09_024865 [Dendrobium nobile]|uniref:FLZ-type domain-containing protein n=1 Tax=Dendrobium nobile TaxID=94219 RepID=A0A8T3AG25_DENNO|nr:hypothetical protein KFK09_024865 [Dendrobium nobile]